MPTATKAGTCRRCGGRIESGQEFSWGQNTGERVHSYNCSPPSAPSGGATPTPTGSAVRSATLNRIYLKASYVHSEQTKDDVPVSCEIGLTEEWGGTISATQREVSIRELAAKARKIAEETVRA